MNSKCFSSTAHTPQSRAGFTNYCTWVTHSPPSQLPQRHPVHFSEHLQLPVLLASSKLITFKSIFETTLPIELTSIVCLDASQLISLSIGTGATQMQYYFLVTAKKWTLYTQIPQNQTGINSRTSKQVLIF